MRKGLALIQKIRNLADAIGEDRIEALDTGLVGCDIKQIGEALDCLDENAHNLIKAVAQLRAEIEGVPVNER